MIEKQDRIDKTHYMMLSALQEEVKSRMLIIRNKQVILDSDVAKLYGIETKAVNQAVKRNADKFPSDYMFHLEKEDVEHLRSQNVTANISAKSRFLPVALSLSRAILRLQRVFPLPVGILRILILPAFLLLLQACS